MKKMNFLEQMKKIEQESQRFQEMNKLFLGSKKRVMDKAQAVIDSQVYLLKQGSALKQQVLQQTSKIEGLQLLLKKKSENDHEN